MRNRMRLTILSVALTMAAPLHVSQTLAAINGTFESDTGGWLVSRSSTDECDVPVRVSAEHALWKGGSYLVALGDTRPDRRPGCSPSYMVRDFDRISDHSFCTVSFDAALWLVAGERAAVILQTDRATLAFEIPGTRDGRWGRYSVSVAGSPKTRLAFAVWSVAKAAAGTRSVLHIDNVSVSPASENETSGVLTPLHAAGIPVFDDVADGGELRTAGAGEAPADCNGNAMPDNYELSQGIVRDKDGDGVPDSCADGRRGINWVLMGMGIFIIAVTIVRLIRNNRSANAM